MSYFQDPRGPLSGLGDLPFGIPGMPAIPGLPGVPAAVPAEIETNPPTPLSALWHPPGLPYLVVDDSGVPRPQAVPVAAAAKTPGVGWLPADVQKGRIALGAMVPGGLTRAAIVQAWSASFIVFVDTGNPQTSYLQAVPPAEIYKLAGRPGVYIDRMPQNGPMTQAEWSKYPPGGQGVQPVPPPSGQTTGPTINLPLIGAVGLGGMVLMAIGGVIIYRAVKKPSRRAYDIPDHDGTTQRYDRDTLVSPTW